MFPFQAIPSDSVYNKHTPKVWPKATEHPTNAATLRQIAMRENDKNSKQMPLQPLLGSQWQQYSSISLSQPSMSATSLPPTSLDTVESENALHRTSVKAKVKLQQEVDFALVQATKKYQRKLMDHVRWLESPCEGEDAQVNAVLAAVSLRKPTDASMRKSMVPLPSGITQKYEDDVHSMTSKRSGKSMHSKSSKTASLPSVRSKSAAQVLPPICDEGEIQSISASIQSKHTLSKRKHKLTRGASQTSLSDPNVDWDLVSWPSFHSNTNGSEEEAGIAHATESHNHRKSISKSRRSSLTSNLSMSTMPNTSSTSAMASSAATSAASMHSTVDPFANQLSQLNLTSLHNSLNPFRRRHDYHYRSTNTRYMHATQPRQRPTDPLDYKDDHLIRPVSKFQAVVQPELGYHATPSRLEVTQTLLQLTRKQILHYHARVIEIGVMVRMMKSLHTHASPGLEAVFTLHAACVRASGVNMNPFILRKQQLIEVLKAQVPAVPEASISRLLLSLDQTNTGIIRYVRLTTAVLAAMDPALLNLSVALEPVTRSIMQAYVTFNVFRAPDSKHSIMDDGNDMSLKMLPSGLSQMQPPNPVKYPYKEFHPYKPSAASTVSDSGNTMRDSSHSHSHVDDVSSVISELTGHQLSGPDAFVMPSSSVSVLSTAAASATSSNSGHVSPLMKGTAVASKTSHTTKKVHNALGVERLSEDEWKGIRGEVLLLQLLHQLYCECSGFTFTTQSRVQPHTQPESSTSSAKLSDAKRLGDDVPTMRLEDLLELFSCCVGSADDELRLKELVMPLQQYLFQRLARLPAAFLSRGVAIPNQPVTNESLPSTEVARGNVPDTVALSSAMDIGTMLKHPELRTLFATLVISWSDLLDAVYLHSDLLREFVRQVRAFRAAVADSTMQRQAQHAGQETSISDAISHFSSEGAHLM